MIRTLVIEGMMCSHCEARVKKTLEAVNGVNSAEVSHVSGKAIVDCAESVSGEVLAAAVTAQGYEVKNIQ